MTDQQHTPEPFGFFKAEPFGWTDCAETDEGAQPLFDQAAIDAISKQRDELLADLTAARNALLREGMQRDELLAALEDVKIYLQDTQAQRRIYDRVIKAIASVKDGAE